MHTTPTLIFWNDAISSGQSEHSLDMRANHPLNMEIKVDIVVAYMLGVFPLFVSNLPLDGIRLYHVSLHVVDYLQPSMLQPHLFLAHYIDHLSSP